MQLSDISVEDLRYELIMPPIMVVLSGKLMDLHGTLDAVS